MAYASRLNPSHGRRGIASAAAGLLLAALMVAVVAGASLGEEVRSWPTPESLG